MSILKEYFNERFNEKVWYDNEKTWEEDKKKMKNPKDEDQSGYCKTRKEWWIMWDQIKEVVTK